MAVMVTAMEGALAMATAAKGQRNGNGNGRLDGNGMVTAMEGLIAT